MRDPMRTRYALQVFVLYAVALYLPVEVAPFYAYGLGGPCDVAVEVLKLPDDKLLFKVSTRLLQERVRERAGRWRAPGAPDVRGHVIERDDPRGGHYDEPLNEVLKLAHVARPRVLHERVHGLALQLRLLPCRLPREAGEQVICALP